MNVKRIYVSVPMSGSPDKGLALARMIEATLAASHTIGLMPHDIEAWEHSGQCPPGYGAAQEGHSSACWLRSDVGVLLSADGVIFGPGWEHSIGCRLEMNVAAHCGIPIYWFDAATAEISDTFNNVMIGFS